MTEFDKQIPKQGAQTADAQFMGLLEPAKTGTGAKGEWKKSKVSFQITGKEKPNKFVFWNQKPESKSQYKTIEELKQFETYRIVWYEKDESYNNQEWVSKTIQVIKDTMRMTQQQHNNHKDNHNLLQHNRKQQLTIGFSSKPITTLRIARVRSLLHIC